MALGMGAGAVLFGGIWLASASLRHYEPGRGSQPDMLGQVGGGALLLAGVVTVALGAGFTVIGKEGIKKIEDRYFRENPPRYSVRVGVGSVALHGTF